MSFDADSCSLLNLFRDTEVNQLKIPKYQRAYSWTEEEVLTFCDDLNEICNSNIEDYFFGAVIMIKDSRDKKTRNIIDGQQRITTFTILMSKLRNLCDCIVSDLQKDRIKNRSKLKYLDKKISDLSQCLEYETIDGDNSYKLELSDTDRSFFNNYLKVSRKNEIMETLKVIIEESIEQNHISDTEELCEYEKEIKNSKDVYKNINKIIKNTKNITLGDLLEIGLKDLKPSEKSIITEKIILSYIKKLESKESIDVYKRIKEYGIPEDDFENIIIFREFSNKDMNKIPISNRRILEAGNIIEKNIINPILDKESMEEKYKDIVKLIDSFMEKTHIVTIITHNEDTAYTMFQVLNDRGRSLGIVDLLRPYTLQVLENTTDSSEYFKEASESWDRLAEKDDCDKYMNIYLESYTKVSQNDKKIHNRYKNIFFNDKEAIKIRNRIKDIEEKYEIYNKLNKGQWPYETGKTDRWNKNRLKEVINKLNYKKCIPLLMAIYDECYEEDFAYVLGIIDRVVFRYVTICMKRATKLTNIYAETIEKVRKNKSFDRESFKEDMKLLFNENGASLEDFEEKIKAGSLNYGSSKKDKLLYFLTTIESYYKPDYENYEILKIPNKTVINDGNIWIEHIYPQNPKKSSKKNEYLEKNKDCIGNLTILEDRNNAILKNKPFEEKIYGYSIEKLSITNILKNYTKWGKEEVEEREKMYIEIAKRIFTLD